MGNTACFGVLNKGGAYLEAQGVGTPNLEAFDASMGDTYDDGFIGIFDPASPRRCDNECNSNPW